MDARIPVQIQPIIETYTAQIDRNLSELVSSIYIVGSIALNGFNPYFSDIDFITLLQRQATMEDIALLGEFHQAIEAQHPQWKMSGIYLQKVDVGKSEEERFYRSRIKRTLDDRIFLKAVIRICNDLFE